MEVETLEGPPTTGGMAAFGTLGNRWVRYNDLTNAYTTTELADETDLYSEDFYWAVSVDSVDPLTGVPEEYQTDYVGVGVMWPWLE